MVWTGTLALVTACLPLSEPGGGIPAWRWPLRPPPRILRPFDPPAHPWEAGHRGTDLAARPGQPVYAAGAGRVGFARDLAGRGVVTVVHGRLRTTYLPVRPTVRAGQRVQAGARIGVVEDVLGHCGPSVCLHWGLRAGVTYFDPLTLLGRGPVRLLPWWGDAPARADPALPPAGIPPRMDIPARPPADGGPPPGLDRARLTTPRSSPTPGRTVATASAGGNDPAARLGEAVAGLAAAVFGAQRSSTRRRRLRPRASYPQNVIPLPRRVIVRQIRRRR